MENQLLDMVAFKKLEKMPTKLELIATIARLINQVQLTCLLSGLICLSFAALC